ncbi:MAG: DNA methyltransferase [Bacilli bacterium]
MSENLEELTKEELIGRIKELKNQLNNEKYGLYFDRKGNNEVFVENKIPILIRSSELSIETAKTNITNILIEGDNYLSLLSMSMSMSEKDENGLFDIIYIDPPYNTGNAEFIYNDKRIDASDGFRHTKWLCFMEKRLKLAKNLLGANGHIFISIDDNEHANLKLLCDSIFGEDSYLNDFIWINNLKGRQISNGGAVKTYEHILLYVIVNAQNDSFTGNIKYLQESMPLFYKNLNYKSLKDEKGEFVLKNELYNTNSVFNEETRPNLVFNIWVNPLTNEIKFSSVDENINYDGFIKIEPHRNGDGRHKYHAWRWSKKKILEETYDLFFVLNEKRAKIFTKIRDLYTTNIKDIITDSTNGNIELSKIIGKGKFNYPKPVKLIKDLISFVDNKNARVLDFFAGSGTTGQAVLELNSQDNGKRSFTLITNNEGDIMTAVCYPRLKSIISGINFNGEKFCNGYKSNLIYYKTELIDNNHSIDQNKYNLVEKCNELLCLSENIFTLIKKEKSFFIYNNLNSKKWLFIYFDYYNNDQFSQMLNELEKQNEEIKIVYLFSLNNEIDANEEKLIFNRIHNVTIKPIPSKIYEIYMKIMDDLKRNY